MVNPVAEIRAIKLLNSTVGSKIYTYITEVKKYRKNPKEAEINFQNEWCLDKFSNGNSKSENTLPIIINIIPRIPIMIGGTPPMIINVPQSVNRGSSIRLMKVATHSAINAVPAHINNGKSLGLRLCLTERVTIKEHNTLKNGPIAPVNGITSWVIELPSQCDNAKGWK